MKPAGYLFLLPAGAIAVLAGEGAPSGLLSAEIKAHIREGLPKFDAAAAQQAVEEANRETGPVITDRDVLVLPTITIKERRLPPDAAEHLMSRRDRQRRWANRYLDEVEKDGELNYLLNRFTIPILSPSKADRGHALDRAAEVERLSAVSGAARSLDAAGSAELNAEIERATREPPPMAVIK